MQVATNQEQPAMAMGKMKKPKTKTRNIVLYNGCTNTASPKTVFISYRRSDAMTARAIYEHLSKHGYDCFLDTESIDSGSFRSIIDVEIQTRAHFVLVLTQNALNRCKESGDFVRFEIETALKHKRNIVPLLFDGFNFCAVKDCLTGSLALLPNYNGVKVPIDYFEDAMKRLRERFLIYTPDQILHPDESFHVIQTSPQQQQAQEVEKKKKKKPSLRRSTRMENSITSSLHMLEGDNSITNNNSLQMITETTKRSNSVDNYKSDDENTVASSNSRIHDNLYEVKSKGQVTDRYRYISEISAKSGKGSSVWKVKIRKSAMVGLAITTSGTTSYQQYKNTLKKGARKMKKKVIGGEDDRIYYALKTMDLQKLSNSNYNMDLLREDLVQLHSLDHPNIVRMQEVYILEETNNLHLVMDYCPGGDLFARHPDTEPEVANIIRQVLSALNYMHDNGMVHHDLRLENIVYSSAENNQIQLVDFGLTAKYFSGDKVYDRAEFMYYWAPEVIEGNPYTDKSDLWSLGVMMYILLSHKRPFYSEEKQALKNKILRGKYKPMNNNEFPWKVISAAAKNLIQSLLTVDTDKRLDASDALNHDWIQQNQCRTMSSALLSKEKQQKVANYLKSYKQTPPLKKVALNVIARHTTMDDISALRRIFQVYDANGDGVISYEELRDGLKKSNCSDEDIQNMFESIGVNKTGQILYSEFLAATILARDNIEEARIAEAFNKIDMDSTGYITRENLRRALDYDEVTKENLINDIFRNTDTSGDGKISYQEFLESFRSDVHLISERNYVVK